MTTEKRPCIQIMLCQIGCNDDVADTALVGKCASKTGENQFGNVKLPNQGDGSYRCGDLADAR